MHPVPVPVADHGDIARTPVFDDKVRVARTFDLSDVPHQGIGAGHTVAGVAHHGHGAHPELEKSPMRGISPAAPNSKVWLGPPVLAPFRNCQVDPVRTAGQAE